MSSSLHLLIADTSLLVCQALAQNLGGRSNLFNTKFVTTFAQLHANCQQNPPDLIMLSSNLWPMPGWAMPGWAMRPMSAVETIPYFHQRWPTIKLILFVEDGEAVLPKTILHAGVLACILKSEPPEAIVATLYAVANNLGCFSQSILSQLAHQQLSSGGHQRWPPDDLFFTERNLQIFQLLLQGHSNDQIAQELYLAPKTIRNALTAIYKKIDVQSRTQAIRWASQRGLSAKEEP